METVGEARTARLILTEANHFQFGPGDDLTLTHFASRTLLWGIAGGGTAECGAQTLRIRPGDVVLLPWAAVVRYRAASADPFLVGTAHLVPSADAGRPLAARPAERASGSLYASADRRPAPGWPSPPWPIVFSGVQAGRLIRLAEAATDYFLADEPDEEGMRAFGHLFERALAAPQPAIGTAAPIPPILAAMQEFARSRLGHPLTTSDLADFASCSLSTAERQFRRYTGLSPRAWLREERLRAAAQLLRTTSLRVADVATACGFQDPHYFTRAFRRRYGVPPRIYGRRPVAGRY